MPIANSEFGAAVIGGKIYAAGGFLEENEHALLIFDPAAGRWSVGPDLPTGTHHAGVVAVQGKLYVVAGTGLASSTLQIFDPATETWSEGAAMPTARTAMATVVRNGKIHAIGGSRSIITGGAVTAHEVYDPATDSWEELAPLPRASEHVFGGVLGGKIYVVGGRNNLANRNDTQIYDPVSDTWTQGARMESPASGHAVGVHDGKIYAYGGEDIGGGAVSNVLQSYDPAADAWTLLEPAPEALHGVGHVLFRGKFYILGGSRVAASGEGTTLVQIADLPGGSGGDGGGDDGPSIKAPGRLRVRVLSPTRIRLRWRDRSKNETGFEVQMKRGSKRFRRIASPSANVKRLVVTGLKPGVTYAFRIRAVASGKRSNFGNEVVVTMPAG